MLLVALHPEGVDRNYVVVAGVFKRALSPSTRRAWIEIAYAGGHWLPRVVALHPEGVDRNAFASSGISSSTVALHPEGVDRNSIYEVLPAILELSPSTRRAWIEILIPSTSISALRCRPPPGGRG